MGWVPMREQHMGDIETIALDFFYQFQVYMAWINKDSFATVIRTDEIAVGVFHQGEVEEYLHSILREAGLLIIGILERDSHSVRESKIGVLQIAVDKVDLHEMGGREIRIIEVRGGEIAIKGIHTHEIGMYQQGIGEITTNQFGTGKHRVTCIAPSEGALIE